VNPTDATEIAALTERLGALLESGRGGLPEEVFCLVSRLMPMVNVDLLIRDDTGRTLLTWRADEFYGPGWHVPGGIVRFKESAAARIAAVAQCELGAEVVPEAVPCRISELTNPYRDVRGHFISLLYRCILMTPLDESLKADGEMLENGVWRWFDRCPNNMIPVHAIYRDCFATTEAAT
jgi:ADP-ribose pyrophosphatase YjhB (NUDIX family)